MSNSKAIGTQSLGACMSALLKKGKTVLLPVGDNERYDLVLEKDGQFTRVQCKTGRLRNGCVRFDTCSTNLVKGKWHHNNYVGQIEAFVVYCPDNDETYFLPIERITANSTMSLRIVEAKNNQQCKIVWANDFKL